MSNRLSVTPLKTGFAASVEMDVPQATSEDIEAFGEVLKSYPVVVIPGQELRYEDQEAFAKKLGPIDQVADLKAGGEGTSSNTRFDRQAVDEEFDRVKHMLATLGTTVWHTDGTYKSVPAHLSMLYGIIVTEKGGETQFADLRAAYDDLPDEMKEMAEGLVAEHSTLHAASIVGAEDLSEENRREFSKCFAYDVVRTLPESGRKTLFLSAHAQRIIGMPVPQGRMILRELNERATAPDNLYTHKWTAGDLVIWDNRCTMHRLRPYSSSDKRVLQRVCTADAAFHPRDPATVAVPHEVMSLL